jgi:ribosomal protein S18 acetylase RimI-like enzyme
MREISTDKNRIDIEKLIQFLTVESYWAKSRSKEQIIKSIDNSMCFGLYQDNEMIGFARVVTDYGVFAYLADVYIDEKHRGLGYAKELMTEI